MGERKSKREANAFGWIIKLGTRGVACLTLGIFSLRSPEPYKNFAAEWKFFFFFSFQGVINQSVKWNGLHIFKFVGLNDGCVVWEPICKHSIFHVYIESFDDYLMSTCKRSEIFVKWKLVVRNSLRSLLIFYWKPDASAQSCQFFFPLKACIMHGLFH